MRSLQLKKFVTTSVLAAIVIFLGLTPYGIIPLGFMNVTILCIPVIIGTVILGLKSGLILGLCFGISSTLRAFGIPSPASTLVSNLLAQNPVYVIIMSLLPRIIVPVTAFISFKLLSKKRSFVELKQANILAESLIFVIIVPALLILFYGIKIISFDVVIILFVIFAIFELLFTKNSDNSALIISSVIGSLTNTVLYLGLMLVFYTACGIDSSAVLTLISGTGIIAGGSEAIAAAVICTPVIKALKKARFL